MRGRWTSDGAMEKCDKWRPAPEKEVRVSRGYRDRQVVGGRTCQFMLYQYLDDGPWIVDADCLRAGHLTGNSYVARIEEILDGREEWSGWPPHLFRFVRDHIGQAMQRDGYSSHKALSVVRAMNEAEVSQPHLARTRKNRL